jgi:pantoate--beta-alanine ligase
MHLVSEHDRVSDITGKWRSEGLSVGFVPTMGALHQGHLSLVRDARRRCDRVVVSIFVNPMQFGPGEDFDRYPRNLHQDCELLRTQGADLVFAPTPQTVYPTGFSTFVEVQRLASGLCATARPGHFRGVSTVCCILFNMVRPSVAVFGEKDYQQLVIVRRMVEDLRMNLKVIASPTVRETDGLAMSSRNAYLSTEERKQAACLYRSLKTAADGASAGVTDTAALKAMAIDVLSGAPLLSLSYIETVDPETLEPVERLDSPLRLVAAVQAGNTRLIDNIPVFPPGLPRRKEC